MVVPQNIVDAAESGDVASVRAWLDEDAAHDVNDVDEFGTGLLNWAAFCPNLPQGIALMELLIARGADVNESSDWTALQLACGRRSVEAIELLLSHGADVNLMGLKDDDPPHPPLMIVVGSSENYARIGDLTHLSKRAAYTNRTLLTYCRDTYACIVSLLRAGVSLDGRANTHPETLLTVRIGDIPPPTHPEFLPKMELKLARDRLKAVRAAGGWRKWTLVPPKKLLRLRSLIARGRARAPRRNPSHRRDVGTALARLMSPNLPNEIAWRVLAYWNPRH